MKEKFKSLKNIPEKFKALDEKGKKLLIIISVVLILLIIITIITSIIFGQLVGNAGKVAGNLRNSGFAVKKGNKAYISSTVISDEEAGEKGIYEISSQNTSKLIDKSEYIQSINLYKGYLYYLAINPSDTGDYIRQIIKIKPNGDKKQILVDNIETTSIGSDALNVSDGWVYFLNAESQLEKIKTNGEKRQPVSDEKISYFQISGNYVYYTTNDNEFKKMKKDGSSVEEIGTNIDLFQVVAGDVYYINSSKNYLVKLNMNDKTEQNIVEKNVKSFNVYEKTIYYAVFEENEDQAIYKMKTSGKDNVKVVDLESAYIRICIVGDWVYYTDKVEGSPYYYALYRVKTNGEDKQKVNI